MTWVEPKSSKKAVSRAGDILISSDSSEEENLEALDIVSNWRSSYTFTLHIIASLLRSKVKDVEKNAIITQRLKRIPSILGKLKRLPNMKLQTMQDIGGCRVVLSDVKKVHTLRDLLLNSKTKNELVRQDDYIENPKDSGYRGIHLIYKYKGKKDYIYNGYTIEIQVRTKIQHSWATAVEVAGTFLKESLKSGEGPEKWLHFFKLVSLLLAFLENCLPENITNERLKEIKEEVNILVAELEVFKKLQAFSVSTHLITGNGNNDVCGYFLILLNIDKQDVKIWSYKEKYHFQATEDYKNFEKKYKDTKEVDIVLVNAKSIKTLKKAYPNYFADSKEFLDKLNEVLAKEI
ncbi:MAG: RelA/SpoT domain-containing protein [Nostoc sp. DedSLP03]|uniref:RelA/SpoT domain-containing protein n=1 Tax=Nostoc sp. DedSLP03 TaxID=3075400 RepID=UPI002AD4EF57|nr:RelA/SpoT domain-containing protein [Nostoc sp. DedSLP03]MDZ7965226.1 RelA/SpoT domain-containing protein [Nostoc sp. DedSLP03]